MKLLIKKSLKTMYPNVGFGDKAFEGVAEYLSTTITEEDQIETAIKGVEPMLKAFQGDIDSRVSSAVDKTKKEAEDKTKGGEDPTEKEKVVPENKDESLLIFLKEIKSEITSLKSDKVVSSRKTVVADTFKDAPEGFRNDILADMDEIIFRDDDHFNSYKERKEKAFADLTQTNLENGLGATKPIFGTTDAKTGVSSSVQNFIEARKNNTGGELAGKEI